VQKNKWLFRSEEGIPTAELNVFVEGNHLSSVFDLELNNYGFLGSLSARSNPELPTE